MIDWDGTLTCDKGIVKKSLKLHAYGDLLPVCIPDGLTWIVNKDTGKEETGSLGDEFTVRNADSVKDQAVVVSYRCESIIGAIDAIAKAGLFKD